ncbi:hypothetical protein D0C36_03145 [Mucilaginibacter conchicola]|uniref:Uncharacterized protein n=1 Tax=Mucilaginibacter conchicola TaxID=2303333 RepID=A0A372NYG8_9SPHI|nr:hypothetical protein [Mucilaginibacter conchicola]RFZ94557.1 hypothetical protein D0C36_03145 [Mucilaginibacter conchicola]
MKKIFYIVLAVIVVGIYSCQKDNSAPAKQGFSNGIAVKGKKDTSPPDPTFNVQRIIKKDTSPPDPKFTTSSTAKKDTSPPDPRR